MNNLYTYFEKFKLLTKHQFWFKQNCSTYNAVRQLYDEYCDNIDQKKYHKILINELEQYRIFGSSFTWSYFNWNLCLSKVFASLIHCYRKVFQWIKFMWKLFIKNTGPCTNYTQKGVWGSVGSWSPRSFSFNSIFIDQRVHLKALLIWINDSINAVRAGESHPLADFIR